MLFDAPPIEKTLSFKQLAQFFNVSEPTLRKRIREKMPFHAQVWYGNPKKRKKIYWQKDIEAILQNVG